jgi:hypothetical protein
MYSVRLLGIGTVNSPHPRTNIYPNKNEKKKKTDAARIKKRINKLFSLFSYFTGSVQW